MLRFMDHVRTRNLETLIIENLQNIDWRGHKLYWIDKFRSKFDWNRMSFALPI